jgi:hypothetical protein
MSCSTPPTAQAGRSRTPGKTWVFPWAPAIRTPPRALRGVRSASDTMPTQLAACKCPTQRLCARRRWTLTVRRVVRSTRAEDVDDPGDGKAGAPEVGRDRAESVATPVRAGRASEGARPSAGRAEGLSHRGQKGEKPGRYQPRAGETAASDERGGASSAGRAPSAGGGFSGVAGRRISRSSP